MSTEQKILTITVEGRAHTGKSTVMAIIEKAMKEAGYEDVEVQTINNEPGVGFKALPVAIARTRVNKIVITEKMANYAAEQNGPRETEVKTSMTPNEIETYSAALDTAIEFYYGELLKGKPEQRDAIKAHFMRVYLEQKTVLVNVQPEKHWAEDLPAGAVLGAFSPNNGA